MTKDDEAVSKSAQVTQLAKQIFAERCGQNKDLDDFLGWFISSEEKAEVIKAEELNRQYQSHTANSYHSMAPSWVGTDDPNDPWTSAKSYMYTNDPFSEDTYEEREKSALAQLGTLVDKEVELSFFLAKRFVDRRLKVLK
jgi:hypothetical protein